MNEGVSKDEFYKRFGESMDSVYGDEIKELVSEELLKTSGDRLNLTERGIDISNSVFEKFIR